MADSFMYKRILTIPEFVDAVRVRVDVFIIEQKCPAGWEPDEYDRESLQYVAMIDSEIVGTARLRTDPPGSVKLERMAVREAARGRGLGLDFTRYLVSEAQAMGATEIWMEAQTHAQAMYEAAGFVVASEPYDQFSLGIPHVRMIHSGKAHALAGGSS